MGGIGGGMSMGRDRFHGNTYNTMVGDEEDFMSKRNRPIVGLAHTVSGDTARGGAIADRLLMGKGKGLAKKHDFKKGDVPVATNAVHMGGAPGPGQSLGDDPTDTAGDGGQPELVPPGEPGREAMSVEGGGVSSIKQPRPRGRNPFRPIEG